MTDEDALLAAIIANPDDDLPRLVYADWLDERTDPRGGYVRLAVDKRRATSDADRDRIGKKLRRLAPTLDPGWVAAAATLWHPFREEQYCYEPGVHPFTEPIGSRGPLQTFESQYRTGPPDPGLVQDILLLHGRELGQCYYGASDFAVRPFVTDLLTERPTPTAADVLAALRVRTFRSDHIPDLNVTTVPFPGYHPGTDNDEIHTDPTETHIFPGRQDPGVKSEVHDALRGYVRGGVLWYVLLHAWHDPDEYEWEKDGTVVLFAVGRSPHGDRLVGVVTAQVCHNLCD